MILYDACFISKDSLFTARKICCLKHRHNIYQYEMATCIWTLNDTVDALEHIVQPFNEHIRILYKKLIQHHYSHVFVQSSLSIQVQPKKF